VEYEPVYIYALVDPRNDEIRYIGKSIDIERRYASHLGDKTSNTGKVAWIGRLAEAGMVPDIKILETANEINWATRESWWIKHGLDKNWRLFNISMGGEGGSIFQLPESLYWVLPKDILLKLERLPRKVRADIILEVAKVLSNGFIEMVHLFVNKDYGGYLKCQEDGRRIAIREITRLIAVLTRKNNKET